MLERRLGHGGMAAVWLARDERLQRSVAVKVLSDTLAGDRGFLARFRREARVAARLSHPGLVKVYDYGAEHGRPFLVMEYVDGGDLGEALAAGRAPDPEALARELLGALGHIHAAGVLHRDVKPQNVLLGGDGRARLTDFGIAQPRDATSLTRTGTVLGTARYLAPEVLAGQAASERSDLYSLGVVLAAVAEQRPAGGPLTGLIEALGSREPGPRPASAAAALRALDRERAPAPEPTVPLAAGPGPPPQAAAPQPRAGRMVGERHPRRGLAVGALVAAVAAVAAIAVLAGGEEEPDRSPPPVANERAEDAPPSEEPDSATDAEQPAEPAPEASGSELNDRGFALINDGRPEEAIRVLRQAVAALEGSGEITYAYALFNLGNALRLAGRPDEAIPILEQRLEIPNQRGVVRRALEAARSDAAGADEGPGRSRDDDD